MNAKWKWTTLSIFGSLVVGAVGSGLWSVVFAPLGSALLRGTLSLVTLGISSARDSVYAHASRDFWEAPSLELVGFLAIIILFTPIWLWLRLYVLRLKTDSTVGASRGISERLGRRIVVIALIIETFLAAVLSVQLLLDVYTNTVIANFHQTLTIASPYLSADQRNHFLARFAKVRNRSDFLKVFDELNSVAEAHSEKRSSFSPW